MPLFDDGRIPAVRVVRSRQSPVTALVYSASRIVIVLDLVGMIAFGWASYSRQMEDRAFYLKHGGYYDDALFNPVTLAVMGVMVLVLLAASAIALSCRPRYY